MEKVYAIIVAAGKGTRMKSDIPKQYLKIKEREVLTYSIEAFGKSDVDAIIIVADKDYHEAINAMSVYSKKPLYLTEGGVERVDSVKCGIDKVKEIMDNEEETYVLIHDGARPLISQSLISGCIKEVKEKKVVLPTVKVKDTIKIVDNNHCVKETPDRSFLLAAQTPQTINLELLIQAYEEYERERESGTLKAVPTDDVSLIELFTDRKVFCIDGEETNIKITTPEDLIIAEKLLSKNL